MKKFILLCILAPLAMAITPAAAAPAIVAEVDISEQRMRVYVNGYPRYNWAVSTARRGYVTPTGTWRPQRLERMWHSRKYNMSPMPFSIFYYKGYAIHATSDIKRLGRPASHGCVRLHPSHAERLFSLVSRYGMSNMRVKVVR